jgi:cyclic beta-1,2-glucan synthetase
MYRAGVEGILGLRREGASLLIDPCIPLDWPGFDASVTVDGCHYSIVLASAGKHCRGIQRALLDGRSLVCGESPVQVPLAVGEHRLELFL